MAIVGEAHIIVRAITSQVKDDIRKGFDGSDTLGSNAGTRMGNSFKRGFLKEADDAYKKFRRLSAVGYIVGPAISGIVAAISALVSGLVAFVSQVSAAVPAALGLAGAFSALIQGAITFKVAMGGVGKALQAGLRAQSSGGAVDATAQINALENARRNLALTIERAGETEENVTRAVNEAWDNYQKSIIDTARAVNDLRRAQKDAAEQTQQLGFDVEDAALAQQRASMSLEEAKRRLQSVSDLPADSSARQEAELAFREADLNYRRAADRNNDLKQQQDEANRVGIAGSDQVINASNAVADAKDAEARAFQGYEDSIVEALRSRRDSQRAILRAEEDVLDAITNLEKAQRGANSGVDQFAEAMKKLSPEAQKFVRYLITLRESMLELRAAAGRQLFPALESSIRNLMTNLFPILKFQLEKTGGALGSFFKSISDALVESKNAMSLNRVMGNNATVIQNFGKAMGNLVTVVIQLLDAARPLTRQFSEWVETVTDGWKNTILADKKSGDLAKTLNYAKTTADQLGQVFKNLVGGLKNIGEAAAGPGSGGELLLDTFEAATRKFKDFTERIKNDGSADEYFKGVARNTISIGSAFTKLAEGFLKLGDNAGVQKFFDTISEPGGAIESIIAILDKFSSGNIGKVMGEVANNVVRILEAFADSESIQVFFGVIKAVTDTVVKILGNEGVKVFIGIISVVHAATVALWLMTVPLSFIGKVWVGSFAKVGKGIMGIGKAAMLALNPVKLLAVANQKLAFASRFGGPMAGVAGVLASIGVGPIIAIVAAIAALAAIIYLAYQNSQKFREAVLQSWEIIKGGFVTAIESVKTAFEGVAQSINAMLGGVGGTAELFKKIGDFLAGYIKVVATNIAGFFKFIGAIIGNVVTVVGNVIGGIIRFIQGFIGGIKSALGIVDTAGTNTETFFDKVRKVFESFWNVASTIINWLSSVVTWLWTNFVNPLLKVLGYVIGWVIGKFIEPFLKVFKWLGETISDNWQTIVQFFEDGVNRVVDFINYFIDIWNTIAGLTGWDKIERLSRVDFNGSERAFKDLDGTINDHIEVVKRAIYTEDEFKKILETTKNKALDVFDTFMEGRNAIKRNLEDTVNLKTVTEDLTEAVEEGSKSHQELKLQLIDVAQEYIDSARAAIENGESTKKAVKRIAEGRQVFIDNAVAMEMSADKAKELADKLGLTPNKIKKEFEVTGVDKLDALNKKLERLKELINAPIKSDARREFYTTQAEILSAKIETQLTVVFGAGQNSSNPLYVSVTNVDDTGGLVPNAATGGVFFPRLGGQIVRVAEAGRPERIEPLDPNGLSKRDKALISYLAGGVGGGTINVYPSAGMNERDLAAHVSREIRSQMRKGAA